jgi:hypothetical protein
MAATQADTLRQSFNTPLLDMIVHGGETCARTLLAYQQELMRFAASRLQSGAELGRTLAQSHDWFEAVSAQQRWFAAAMTEYAREGQRLLHISSELAIEHTHQVGEDARQAARTGTDSLRKAAGDVQSAAEATESYLRGATEAVGDATKNMAEEGEAAAERSARRARRSGE